MSDPRDRFNDGLSAASRPANATLAASRLEIRDDGGRLLAHWALDEVCVIDENEANGSMVFALGDVEGPRLVLYPSPEREAILAARPELRRWRRRRGLLESRTVLIWSLAMLAIVAAGYFGWRPLAGSLATLVPPIWEQRLGEAMHESMIEQMRVCENTAGLNALRNLAERIAPPSLDEPPFTVDVVRIGMPNAIALPGNHILVFEGLIDESEGPEMLAGVLAHEIAHLDLDHPTRRIVEQLGLGALVTIAFGGSNVGDAGFALAMLAYSREAETEADARAIELLEEAGLRSDGLGRFFRKIGEDMPDSELPDWLSTHPELAPPAAAPPGTAEGDAGLAKVDWAALRGICGKKTGRE
ncbi:MAG: M48 family metallopeptidase [Dongiaceae bacterium]